MTTDALSTLARRAKKGYARTKQGRSGWLAGTFELATALSQARKKLPRDQEFHAWIAKAGLASISKDDRAALIYMRRSPEGRARILYLKRGVMVLAAVCPTTQIRKFHSGFAGCETADNELLHS